MSKQYGNEDFLANLVAKACISILPEKTTFNVDNVRVLKILGSGLQSSSVIQVSHLFFYEFYYHEKFNFLCSLLI